MVGIAMFQVQCTLRSLRWHEYAAHAPFHSSSGLSRYQQCDEVGICTITNISFRVPTLVMLIIQAGKPTVLAFTG
jgi:hypothetical protein